MFIGIDSLAFTVGAFVVAAVISFGIKRAVERYDEGFTENQIRTGFYLVLALMLTAVFVAANYLLSRPRLLCYHNNGIPLPRMSSTIIYDGAAPTLDKVTDNNGCVEIEDFGFSVFIHTISDTKHVWPGESNVCVNIATGVVSSHTDGDCREEYDDNAYKQ